MSVSVLVSGLLTHCFSTDDIFIIVHYFLLVDGLGQASHHHHHYQHDDTKYDKDEIVVQRKAETISQRDRVDTTSKHWSYCPVVLRKTNQL